MAKNITVYFADGSQHVYQGVPDDVTADQAISRARKDFAGRSLVHIARSSAEEPERTIGGYAKEALKGLVPGAVSGLETAITGAAALLPEGAERAVREKVTEVAQPVKEAFAAAPGYEDTTVRQLSEAVGSTAPFLGAGIVGKAALRGLALATGAGEARQRAEAEDATEDERAVSTAAGLVPGYIESIPPVRILRRFGFADEAIAEVAGLVPALKRVAKAGGEEALQEASSQVLQNLIAKGVYKPEEAVLGGVGESAALGGGAGAIVGAIAELALGRRLRGVEPPPEERKEEPVVTPPPTAAAPAVEEEAAPEEISRREALEQRARELRAMAMQEEAQTREPARKPEEARIPKRPLGEEDQMGLALEGGVAQPDLFAPEPGQPETGLYRPAEEALAGLRPRSRAYKEEAKDLGLRLDKKGNLKPNQFIPEITSQVSPDQERFEFEQQQQLPLTLPPTFEGQGDLFAQEPIPPGPTVPFTREAPVEEAPAIEVPKEQFALNLPGIPMESLTPRDRVLRAMAISEDKKNIPNLQFATQLRPMELQRTLGDLKKEGTIGFNKQANEWELTPAGVERVRSGPEVKPARPRRRAGMPVQQPRTEAPATTGVGERGVAGAGAVAAQPDVGAEPSKTALEAAPVDRMALIRRAQEKRVAQQAISQVADRRTALRTQAIDAFDNDKIDERTYTAVTEELKKPVPNFARVTSMLEGTAKPKREKDVGLKFQRGEVGAGAPVEQVQAAANEAVRGWTNAPKIVVASSANDPVIPEALRAGIPKDAPGFYRSGTTYIIADRAKDAESVRGTVFHESLGHYGLEQEFQGGLQDVMQGIFDTNSKMQAAAKARMEKFGLNAPTAVEEVLAERSEAGPIKEPWLRDAFNRVAAYIRNFLRQRGFVSKYSDNDVSQILRQAHRRVTDLKKAPYDPFNPAVRYQRSPEEQRKGDRNFINAIGKIPDSLPAATKETYQAARNAASNVPSATRRAFFSILDPHEIDRMYGKQIKSEAIGNLWKNANSEGVALRNMQEKIMDNMTRWGKVMEKYSPAEQERIRNLFMDTTVTKIEIPVTDAKGKTKLKEVTGVEVLDLVDPSRNINWKADVDHPLYKQISALFARDPALKNVYKELRLAYVDDALAVEKQLQQYLTPDQWQKILNKLNEQRIRVYLPLFRKGKFKLTYIDAKGVPVALQFENSAERELAEKEILREGVDPKTIEKSMLADKKRQQIPPTGFFADVVAELKKAGVDDDIVFPIIEHYLDYLPADSVLQRGRRRKGTAGYSNDFLTAYANVADSYARRIVNMEFAPKYLQYQEEFKKDLYSAKDRGDIEAQLADDLESYVDKYMDFVRNPNLDNWGAKLGYASFQLYLGGNISTAVTQVFDTPTVLLSRLLGKGHNIGGVGNALIKASSVFFSTQKSPEMQELLRRGLNSGILREQRLQDIAEFKNLDSRWEKLKANVDRITAYAFNKTDIFNRQVGLIAAYDLQKAKNKTPPGQFDEKAFNVAESVIADVYGSSFPKAAAPIMGSDLAKTALTFKRFGIKRMHLLGTAYRDATRGLDPNDPDSKIIRDAARKELIGYFGTAFLTAGVQGMPMVGAAMALTTLLNGILGDDDEPYNPDFALREAVGLFAYKGPINYLLGIDMASRTGWTGMFWREDPKRMAEVGPVTYAVEQALGPAYSYAVGVPRAFDYMDKGQYDRAFEQIMPRSVANISKGFRYATEGATTANGAPLVKDVSAYNSFMQILGFRPSEVAEAGDIAGATKRMESKIRERRNAIIARAAMARMSGDIEGFQEAMEEARAFSRKYPGRGISPEIVMGAVQRRMKNLARSVNGVTLDPKLAGTIYEELGVEPGE